MSELVQRKKRDFEEIKTVSDVIEILKQNSKTKKLKLKYSVDDSGVQLNDFLEDKSIIIITDPEYRPINDTIIIYGLLDKYIEIDLKVEETLGPGHFRCSIKTVRKATTGRRYIRFRVSPEQVTATNFRVSKHTIDVSNFNIPTGIKVILDQFQSKNSKLSDIVKVGILSNKEDILLALIRKTGKTLFIEDVANPEAYNAITEDFLDLKEYVGDELNQYIKRFIERGYKSIILSPIIYISESEVSVPFAYIQIISKSENFTLDRVLEVKGMVFGLIDRIRDANTQLVKVTQHIVDISKGGVKLKITDENLKKYMVHAKGFIFDIVFKLQAPITIFGEIKYTRLDEKGDLYLGIDFAGNSSRKDEMKRFYSYIGPMEIEYKNKLIKERKRQIKS